MSDETPEEESREPSTLVVDEGTLPCGCHVVKFSDDREQVSPCAPCGFLKLGEMLNNAANVCGSIAHGLRRQQSQAAMANAVARATQGKT